MSLGACGVVSVASNLIPAPLVEMVKAMSEQRLADANAHVRVDGVGAFWAVEGDDPQLTVIVDPNRHGARS